MGRFEAYLEGLSGPLADCQKAAITAAEQVRRKWYSFPGHDLPVLYRSIYTLMGTFIRWSASSSSLVLSSAGTRSDPSLRWPHLPSSGRQSARGCRLCRRREGDCLPHQPTQPARRRRIALIHHVTAGATAGKCARAFVYAVVSVCIRATLVVDCGCYCLNLQWVNLTIAC